MKSITIELKTINTVFPTVATVSIDNVVAGFICENKESNREEKPQSIVLLNGETLGDYCCTEHAAKALAKHHCGNDGIYVSDRDAGNMGPLGILLIAALMAAKEKAEEEEEKSPH
ncbi:hypothetical protein ACSFCX_10270 [Yokenella regensburgei]|uniref:hypothetical protein n=1 Tax=Yokenella regensburgei TaxID=158877 RepID=UPI003ED8EBD0